MNFEKKSQRKTPLQAVVKYNRVWSPPDAIKSSEVMTDSEWDSEDMSYTEIIPAMGSAKERGRYTVKSSLIDWSHT